MNDHEVNIYIPTIELEKFETIDTYFSSTLGYEEIASES